MNTQEQFEQMRPYKDTEVKAAIQRLFKHEELNWVIRFIYSSQNETKVLEEFKNINSVDKFQTFFSSYAVEQILNKTANGFTYSGLENIEKNKAYLFIANHRDIVMDSAIMQWLLKKNGFQTSQITFGSNLMSSQFIIDMGKLNKMFTFYRGGSKIDIYRKAILHSSYIKDVIVNKNESIWIAQRDGRTKDGNDITQSALIKMLLIKQNDFYNALKDLNIVPVVISYEHEPCDIAKINEMYVTNICNEKYVKSKGEDFRSVLTGITEAKGHVNMSFGKPLNTFLKAHTELQDYSLDDFTDKVCHELNKQVYQNYKLYPINYIAYDKLMNESYYINKEYNESDYEQFNSLLKQKASQSNIDEKIFKKLFVEMYAAPVINYLRVS